MLTYATVIVTYNRKEAVRNALLRQFRQTVQAQKIILVDNHSTDGTKEYIQDILDDHHDQVKYLRLDENLGGSGGFYYGMRAALEENTDLIAISDDDASYDQKYFEKILKTAEVNPKDMAFCGVIYENGKLHPSTAKFIRSDNTYKFRLATKEDYKKDFYVDNWSFVGPVFRKELIEEIGLPNKDFFIWFDDSEYAIRMHLKGYKFHLVKDARIDLYTKGIPSRNPLWKKYYGFRNEIYAIRKYGRNRVIANIYPFFMLFKKYASIFIRNDDYSGRKLNALRAFTKAFKDAYANNLGKNIDPATSKYDK